jgi:thiamine biosynthesis lipoprotein
MKNLLFIAVLFVFVACKTKTESLKNLQGNAIGTTYSIKYLDESNIDFSLKIDSLITAINKSVSTYIPTSDISKINKGDSTVVIDDFFKKVYLKSERIYKETNGEFDPTVGILVNAWGFGPGESIEGLDSTKIKELLKFVGFNKVQLVKGRIQKKYQEIYFDFNSIAKGFLVDVVSELFEENNVENYLVEIGGEIRGRGVNQNNDLWRVAIENPNFDGTRSFATTINLNNESMATSGNYRKYRTTSDGKKFVHTINAKTGFATESNLLSASVITNLGCTDADAYATAFMAMGLEKTKLFLDSHKDLKVFLIYANEEGELETFKSSNFIN